MRQFYGSAETSDSVLILENTLAQGVGGGALAFTLVEVQAAYSYPQPTDASPRCYQSVLRNGAYAYPQPTEASPQSAITNLLTTRQNKAGTAVISQYNYSVNVIGQRSAVSQTGTAFSSARSIAWGYDPLGQVISADSSLNAADRETNALTNYWVNDSG